MSRKQDSLDRKRKAMTEAFVTAVETAGKWLPDWICQRPRNFITGKAYRGINCVMLPVAQMLNGWESPLFAGKGQIKEAGGRIKDDEFRNATWVFFWGSYEKKKTDPVTGEETTRRFWFPKAYQVWNLEQTEGVREGRIKGLTTGTVDGAELQESAEALLRGYIDAEKIKTAHGDPAFWPSLDTITMPNPDEFADTEGYYNALSHEAVHSTGVEARTGRTDFSGWRGGHEYSREELVAQMGAAFIRAELGLSTETGEARDAAYLKNWLDAMSADPSMLFDAAQDAEKALQYIRKAAGVADPSDEPAREPETVEAS